MFSYLFGRSKKNAVVQQDMSVPLLAARVDPVKYDEKRQPFLPVQDQSSLILHAMPVDQWNIVLQYSDFDDLQTLSLCLNVLLLQFLRNNPNESHLIYLSAQAREAAAYEEYIRAEGHKQLPIQHSAEKKKNILKNLASFIPGGFMIGYGSKWISNASTARTAAAAAIEFTLLPTCQYSWPGTDPVSISENVIDLCGYFVTASTYGEPKENNGVCDYWSSMDRNKFTYPPGCSKSICMDICRTVYTNAAENDWNGGWMIACGAVALVVGNKILRRYLGSSPLDETMQKPFTTIPDATFRKKVADLLEMKQEGLEKLSIVKVLVELDKKQKAIKTLLAPEEKSLHALRVRLFPPRQLEVKIEIEEINALPVARV